MVQSHLAYPLGKTLVLTAIPLIEAENMAFDGMYLPLRTLSCNQFTAFLTVSLTSKGVAEKQTSTRQLAY